MTQQQIDPTTEISRLQQKRKSVVEAIEAKKASIAVLKNTYADKKRRAKEQFGVDTPEALNQRVAELSQELTEKSALLAKAIQLYEAGNFTAAANMLTTENSQ